MIYLPDETGTPVPIQPNVFHNIMELFPVGGWQITQEPNNIIKVGIVNPEINFNESKLVNAISTELTRRKVNHPIVRVAYATSLERMALGKTFLIKALQ